MSEIHQKLARKVGDLATEVLFSPEVGAHYQLTAVQLQNADIAKTLGTEADATGLLAVFGEAVSNPKYRDQLPTTSLTGLQLRDEYLGQLEAEKQRAGKSAGGPVGDMHVLNAFDTLKSRIAADLYKQKDAFYTGMAGWVESLSTVQGRAKLSEKGLLPQEMLQADTLPVMDAGYLGVLPAVQAAARLKLAHEVIALRQQGADAADIAKAKAAWEEACLAEPTSSKVGGSVETLAQNFLNTRQLDFARKDMANPNSSAELKLSSQFQLTNHMGHVLTCLVEADPALLQRPEVQKAVAAMPALADSQFQAVKNAVQSLNADPARAAAPGVLRSNLLATVDAAVTPAPKAVEQKPEEVLETIKGLGQRLWDAVKDVARQIGGFIQKTIARFKGEEVKAPVEVPEKAAVPVVKEAPGDLVLAGIAAASEALAQVYPQNQPRIGASVKEQLDAYVVRQAKDLGLGEHVPLIQSAVQAAAVKGQQASL